MATCSNGHENPEGQAFCGGCGEPLGTKPGPDIATEQASTEGNAPTAVVAAPIAKKAPKGDVLDRWVAKDAKTRAARAPRPAVVSRVEEIQILTGKTLDRPYRVLGEITARVTAGAAWNKARTVEDVNSKLREVALKRGANAVIDVRYLRGVSMTSWKALTATGTAVVVETADRQCPHCAESIRREANVCRFCGRDVEPLSTATVEQEPGLAE
jgi:hypothetical protein